MRYCQPGPRSPKQAYASNTSLFTTPLEVFICPSDPEAPINRNRPFRILPPQGEVFIAKSNYPGVAGDEESGVGRGVFHTNSTCARIRDITDGTSNTFLVGERRSPEGQWAAVWACSELDLENPLSNVWSLVGLAEPRMMDGEGPTAGPSPEVAFGSAHVGGAHFLMCDGAVRFISENIQWGFDDAEEGIYNFLAGKADGKVVGEF